MTTDTSAEFDDVKMFLRSMLISAPGVKQDDLPKEYAKVTGEKLLWKKFGYTTLFDLLTALDGEVARMEFSTKHEDNVIYAIPDKSSYTSKHALKNANKGGDGPPAKTPQEMLVWRQARSNSNNNNNNRNNSNNNNRNNSNNNNNRNKNSNRNNCNTGNQAVIAPVIACHHESPATADQWPMLMRLMPSRSGGSNDCYFMLCIKNKHNKNVNFQKNDVLDHFKEFSPRHEVLFKQQSKKLPFRCAFILFPTYLHAYCAWRSKHATTVKGEPIQVQPYNHNPSLTTYRLFVSRIPRDIKMLTFVKAFAQHEGLIHIRVDPKDMTGIIAYKNEELMKKAMYDHTISLESRGQVKLNVTRFNPDGAKSQETKLPSAIDLHTDLQKDLLKVMQELAVDVGNAAPTANTTKEEAPTANTTKEEAPTANTTKEEAPVAATSTVTVEEQRPPQGTDLLCGFPLDFEQMTRMFRATYGRTARTAKNVADRIDCVLTQAEDACRFWVLLLDKKDLTSKLLVIEAELNKHAPASPVEEMPNVGCRGSARYQCVDSDEWYRCWVMETYPSRNELKVFWCDYGNTGVVKLSFFRQKLPQDFWSVPPLAIPCKFHGYETVHEPGTAEGKAAVAKLSEVFVEEVIQANVVKTANYSQGHIIELSDVSLKSAPDVAVTDVLLDEGVIRPIIEDDITDDCWDVNSSEEFEWEEDIKNGTSDHDADNEMKVGKICDVKDLSKFYLHLGDLTSISEIERNLEHVQLTAPCKTLKAGQICLLSTKNQRRRVEIVQQLSASIVEVFHVDYGASEDYVDPFHIYPLSVPLQNVPFSARPARLIGISQPQNHAAVYYLKSFAQQPLRFKILAEDNKGMVSVEIFSMDSLRNMKDEINTIISQSADSNSSFSNSKGILGATPPCTPQKNEWLRDSVENSTARNKSRNNVVRNGGLLREPEQNGATSKQRGSFEFVSSNLPRICPLMDVNSAEATNSHLTSNGRPRFDSLPQSNGRPSSRPLSPSYPPPNPPSNNRYSRRVNDYVVVEGTKATIGGTAQTGTQHMIAIDFHTKRLVASDLDLVKSSCDQEQNYLWSVLQKLEVLTNRSQDYLATYYKELKMKKLEYAVRVRESRKALALLTKNYHMVSSEIESILAIV